MYQANMGIQAIATQLGKEGRRMNVRTIHYILNNPQYCGKNRWNHRSKGKRTHKDIINEGSHEPLITEEEFNRVQQILGIRKKRGKAATSDYPFTGILKCGRCGNSMVGSSRQQKTQRYKFYRCSGRVNYGSDCTMPRISEEVVTRAFLDSVDLKKSEWAKYIKMHERPKNERTEAEKLERELQTLQTRKKRWQVAFANDLLTLEELKAHTNEDRKREQYLKAELEKVEVVHYPQITKNEIIQLLSQLKKTWYAIDDDVTKKEFIYYLFSSITINTDEIPRPHHVNELKVAIHWELK